MPKRPRMSVRLPDGRLFKSVKDCAEAFGLAEDTVYAAIAKDRLATLGTGRARPNNTGPVAKPRPFKFYPHVWPSAKACARELGIPYGKFAICFKPSEIKRVSTDTLLRRRMELEKLIITALRRRKNDS